MPNALCRDAAGLPVVCAVDLTSSWWGQWRDPAHGPRCVRLGRCWMLRLHSCLPLRWTYFHLQCFYQSSCSGLPTQSCFDLFYCVCACVCVSLSNLVATYIPLNFICLKPAARFHIKTSCVMTLSLLGFSLSNACELFVSRTTTYV